MNLQNNTSWLFSIIAIVALFAGGSFFLNSQKASASEMIELSQLSNADMDLIFAVKSEMQAAKIRNN